MSYYEEEYQEDNEQESYEEEEEQEEAYEEEQEEQEEEQEEQYEEQEEAAEEDQEDSYLARQMQSHNIGGMARGAFNAFSNNAGRDVDEGYHQSSSGFGTRGIGGGYGSRDSSGLLPHGYSSNQSGPIGPPSYVNHDAHFVPQARQEGEPYWEYSNCSGNRKALLIGINYIGQEGELAGCHSDVDRMTKFVMERYGFQRNNMVILKDDPSLGPKYQPTRANITTAMQWLVQNAQAHDALLFHYSGHGGQEQDTDGDEKDGTDETICPVDYARAGMMTDDEMHELMISPLPAGVRLTAIFDSCHSGSALDLPYNYSTSGNIKDPMISEVGRKGLMDAATKYFSGDKQGALKGLLNFGKTTYMERKAANMTEKHKASPADVVLWSGCKDDQTSADATEDNTPTGAMSWAFMKCLNDYPQQTYRQLLNTIRDTLKEKQYTQRPQLSVSHPMDLDLIFVA